MPESKQTATDSKQTGSGQPAAAGLPEGTANAQATVTAGALPEGTPGVVPSAPGGPVVVAAPDDLSAMTQEFLAETAAGLPGKKEYSEQQKEAARGAVLYFRSLAQSPWLPVSTDDVIRHMAAIAEIVATDIGHTIDASFIAGRTGDPHERAPGKDDLPESRR